MAIQLYIREQLVDLDGVISMPITKQFDDMENPTAVKNMLSKTISIPATPQNNRIFGNIWRIDHINGGLFNPSKREPFLLANNGTMVTTGYIKLIDVKQVNGNPRSYEINLFGGLGDFFYSLSGDGKDMKDLILPNNGLSHKINAGAIINPPEGMKYFLSYQGRYDSFDSKTIYNPNNGAFTELTEEQDEHQRNEFRSYYQRPAFSIKMLMEAIFTQSGFNVSVSELFKQTPYWLDTYLALNTPDKNGSDISYNGLLYGQNGSLYPVEQGYLYGFNQGINTSGGGAYEAARFRDSDPSIFDQTLDPSTLKNTGFIFLNSLGKNRTLSYDYGFQLVARVNGAPANAVVQNNGINNGPAEFAIEFHDVTNNPVNPPLLHKTQGGEFGRNTLRATLTSGDATSREGLCTRVSDGKDNFKLQGAFSVPATVQKIRVRIKLTMARDINSGSTVLDIYWNSVSNPAVSYKGRIISFFDPNSYIRLTDSVNARSNTDVSYSSYMTRGTSQLSFVKNFFKAFGMLWEKDPLTNSVSVLTRNEFFADHKIADWTERIDYSKEVKTTPLFFDYRYGVLGWGKSNTRRVQQYYEQFGRQYGSMRVDTGYNFDNPEKDFITDDTLKNVAMSMEFDNLFLNRNGGRRDDKILPAIFNAGDSSRARNTETMQILFWNGLQPTSQKLRITDDLQAMVGQSLFCWTASGGDERSTYPSMSRLKTSTNGRVYSLDFSKPQLLYYPATDANYPPEATIYRRFWDRYLNERLTSDTRVMTCYVYITEAEFSTWRFNTFVKIQNTLWHVNKIENFDALRQQSTKVQLVRVNDINAYINGQTL